MTTNYLVEGFKIININGEEEIIQIPYNIHNQLITENELINMLNHHNVKIDKIHNIEVFYEAFTHKSYCKKTIFPDEILEASKKELCNPINLLELRPSSFERLEYLGDRVLKLVVSNYLYNRYPNENEGFMTRLQTKLEDKKELPILSKELGLGKYFIISKHIESMNGRNLDKIHEDVFESFIAALYLSNGFEPCLLLITNLLEILIDYSEKLYCDNNYKDALLRHHHIQEWSHPKYDIIYFEGPAHKRKYVVGVQKHNALDTDDKRVKYIGYGIGNSHKEGAQQSAKMALIINGVLKEDQYSQADIYYPNWDKIEKGTLLSNIKEEDTTDNIKEEETTANNKEQDDNNKEQDDDNKEQDDDNLSVCSDKSV